MANSSLLLPNATQSAASPPIRVFGAVSYALLSSTSVAMNVLLIAVLAHGHSQFRRSAFFTLAWQMIICDLMTQAVQLIVAVPVTFTGEAVYGHPFWYYAVLFFDTLAYNATLHFSGLLTLSRVCLFFLPRLNRLLFSSQNIPLTILALWLYLLGYCACWNLIGCRKAFSETEFYMFHECKEPLGPAGVLFKQVSFCLSTYLPLLMLLAYIFCFLHIRYFFGPRKSRSVGVLSMAQEKEVERIERARRQREANFLIQSFIICGFLEVQNLAFDLVPLLSSSLQGDWPFLATFAENWISILLNSISPLILFSFNADVRKCLAQLLPCTPVLSPPMAQPGPVLSQSLTISPSQLMRPPNQPKLAHSSHTLLPNEQSLTV